MKDWHETMIEHLDTCKKRIREERKVLHLYPYLDLIYVGFHFR